MKFERQSQRLFLAAFIVAEIGAGGQALLLYHELMDTLPYKALSIEAYNIYSGIARTGAWSSLIVSVMIAQFVGRQKLWLMVLAPTISSPIIFGLVYRAYSYFYLTDMTFGEFSTGAAAAQFYSYCFSLLYSGAAIGSIVALAFYWIERLVARQPEAVAN